ncbi:MAG: response regulator transcription factor [Prevotellaceae bacterium]|jgi:DNA-binding NarL/FixJ family response regulator|nr:response regulator transcription factor [Prevotellaceae bacterium]
MQTNRQRIVIAESSQMLRKGLVQSINQLPYVDKVVELDDKQPIPEQLADYRPTIVIINPLLAGTGITAGLREFLNLDNSVHLVALVYTLFDQQYLQLYDAVITINDTQADIANKLKSLSNIKKIDTTENEELSDREKEILVTLVKGLSNKEIADYHNISIHTVITHRRNITRKLNIHSPSGLTVYAIVNNLVDLNDIKL